MARAHIDINGDDVRSWSGYRADRLNRIVTLPTVVGLFLRGIGSQLTAPAYFVVVVDGEAAGLDTDGGRWQAVCDPHGNVSSHETLALALQFASAPEEWCEECMVLARGAEKGWTE